MQACGFFAFVAVGDRRGIEAAIANDRGAPEWKQRHANFRDLSQESTSQHSTHAYTDAAAPASGRGSKCRFFRQVSVRRSRCGSAGEVVPLRCFGRPSGFHFSQTRSGDAAQLNYRSGVDMAKISLEPLRTIDGYVASALV